MTLDMTVKVGDLLTSVSVLIAGATLSYGWWKDRSLRRREQADAARTAAAQALAKLERWVEIAQSFEQDIQGLLVETTQVVDESHGDSRGLEKGRDHLFLGLNEAWRKLSEEQRALEIESSAVELYGRRPDAYDRFKETLAALKNRAETGFAWVRDIDTQGTILGYEKKHPGPYQPATLGNELRSIVGAYAKAIKGDLAVTLDVAERYLSAIIRASDVQVLDRSWRPTDTPT